MQPWDERVYTTIALKRSAFFKPPAILLSKLGVTPNMTSYTGLLLGIAFVYVIGHSLVGAFWLLVAFLLMDQFDGAIARYKKIDSDRGKFVDVAVDSTTFALVVIGLAHAGLVSGSSAAAFVYLNTVVRVLMAIRKNIGRQNEWLFYSGAGPFPSGFIYATYALFALRVFTHINWLQASVWLFTAVLTLLAVIDFLAIKRRR